MGGRSPSPRRDVSFVHGFCSLHVFSLWVGKKNVRKCICLGVLGVGKRRRDHRVGIRRRREDSRERGRDPTEAEEKRDAMSC